MTEPQNTLGVYSGGKVFQESQEIIERALAEKPLEATIGALQRHPLFQGCSKAMLMQMLQSGSDTVGFHPGGFLCRSGQPVDSLLFVLCGRAKAELRAGRLAQQAIVLDLLGPGSLLGLMSLIDKGPHSATVVAMTWVEVVRLDMEAMRSMLYNDLRWYKICAEIAAERLRNSSTWLEALLS